MKTGKVLYVIAGFLWIRIVMSCTTPLNWKGEERFEHEERFEQKWLSVSIDLITTMLTTPFFSISRC